ncbi:integrase core domain-containing protein [Halomonas caseinilytica]|uniref:integrase core domain-containing protein n=1 Tax=Halomonas caseinilytica TaxID=438744 RepID=UPI0008488127
MAALRSPKRLWKRDGHTGLAPLSRPLALRPGNGLILSSRHYTSTVKAYGLIQKFTTPYTPEQSGLVERFFRSLKEECLWQHRFESLSQPER